MEVDLRPKKCNICGGVVVYTDNSLVYGKKYGSGMMYYCTECGAYVGTHVPRPDEALGLLANKEMRDLKMKCHELFDRKWKAEKTSKGRYLARGRAYSELASKLGIPIEECHIGYFDIETLRRVYSMLKE